MELKFPIGLEKNEVLIERDGIKIEVPWPVQIQILKERNKKAKYDVIRSEKNIHIAEADVEVNKENRVHIIDMWEQNTNNIKLSRKVACISAEKETAIRISTEFHCKSKHAKNFDDYQFVIPGAFYNKNDTDQNGQDDYLGTFEQDYICRTAGVGLYGRGSCGKTSYKWILRCFAVYVRTGGLAGLILPVMLCTYVRSIYPCFLPL